MEYVSKTYNQAVALHRRIMANAQSAQESLYEVCKGLKEMRDSKLYKVLEYRTFEEYCETEVGIKHSQAYKFIAIAENMPEDFIHSSGKIGVTKLALLCTLSEDQREEITETTDLATTSVKELEKKIADLKAEKETAENELCEAKRRTQNLLKKNVELVKQVEELENRPVEVAVQVSHEEENLRKAMVTLNSEHDKAMNEIQEENIRYIRSLNDKHNEELTNLRAEYERKLSEVETSTELTIDTAEVFKAYLSAAVDSTNRLIDFIKTNPDVGYTSEIKTFFKNIITEMEG
jgi:hypothetical protein